MANINLRKMPDDLMRQVKAAAALRGITMRDFTVEALQKALLEGAKQQRGPAGRK